MFDAFKVYFAFTMTGTFHVKKSVTHGFACLYLCLWLVFAATTSAEDCDPWKCKGPLRFYKDVNCTPIFDEAVDKCCPVRYDCSHLKLRSPNKCYANGWEYEDGERVPDEEVHPCKVRCTCNGSDGMFRCLSIYCNLPEPYLPNGCYYRHRVNTCCGGDIICPKPGETIHECIIDGETYKDGDIFYPSKNPDMVCQCSKDYAGQNIAPFCKVINCNIELYHLNEIRQNCVPIFFDNTRAQCPNVYRCQKHKDVVIRTNSEEPKSTSDLGRTTDQMQCLYGNITMEIGDELKEGTDSDSVCVKCKCEVPPTLTCNELPYDECDRNTHQNFCEEN